MIFFFRILFFIALFSISVLAFLPDYNALPSIVSLSDLINHAIAFSVLTALYTLAYRYPPFKRSVLLLLGYGAWIEMVQAFLPTRSSSLEDIAADSAGIVLGGLLMKGIRPFLERKKIV